MAFKATGITLVEILLGISLISVIAFLLASVFIAHFKLFTDQSTVIDVSSQNKIAIDEITNQIRQSQAVVSTCANCGGDSTGSNTLVLRLWPLDTNGQPTDPGVSNYDYIVYKKEAATFTGQITSSSDDVNEDGPAYDENVAQVWIGTGQNTGSSYTGLKFNNVNIPKGASITAANIQVYNGSDQWIQTDWRIFADDIGNSQAFSSGNKPSQRTLTSASVSHSDDVNWSTGNWYSLDDITPLIQEVVNRSDWSQNNSLSIIIKGTGQTQWGRKFVTSFDGQPTNAPKLSITNNTYTRLIRRIIPAVGVSSRQAETKYIANNVSNLQFAYDNADPTQSSEIIVTVTTTGKSSQKTSTLTQSSSAILRNK